MRTVANPCPAFTSDSSFAYTLSVVKADRSGITQQSLDSVSETIAGVKRRTVPNARCRSLPVGRSPSTLDRRTRGASLGLSLIHISEPTRLGMISYAVFCLKKKKK